MKRMEFRSIEHSWRWVYLELCQISSTAHFRSESLKSTSKLSANLYVYQPSYAMAGS